MDIGRYNVSVNLVGGSGTPFVMCIKIEMMVYW